MPIGPVMEPEHEEAIITEESHKLLQSGQFNKVPVIVGLNSNEAKSFLGLFIGNFYIKLFKVYLESAFRCT